MIEVVDLIAGGATATTANANITPGTGVMGPKIDTASTAVVGDPSALPESPSGPSYAGASTRSSVAENADYVGGVNVTDKTTDILNDPNAFIDSNDARLSDKVPTIDANTEGTSLDGSNYDMDVDRLNVANNSAAIDTAAKVVKPNDANTYQAATTAETVKANLATAATMNIMLNACQRFGRQITPMFIIDRTALAVAQRATGSMHHPANLV